MLHLSHHKCIACTNFVVVATLTFHFVLVVTYTFHFVLVVTFTCHFALVVTFTFHFVLIVTLPPLCSEFSHLAIAIITSVSDLFTSRDANEEDGSM